MAPGTFNRIDHVKMTKREQVQVLAGKSPESASVCYDLLTKGEAIDPITSLGGLLYLYKLDKLRIYDEEILALYKDVCGQDLAMMMAVLRAYQLGLKDTTKDNIKYAIENQGDGLNLESVMSAVQKRLPLFNARKIA